MGSTMQYIWRGACAGVRAMYGAHRHTYAWDKSKASHMFCIAAHHNGACHA